MKGLIVYYTIIISFLSCQGQISKDKLLIEKFVNKYIVNNSNLSVEGIDEYIAFSDYVKEAKIEGIMILFLETQQKELKDKDGFEVLSYKEFIDLGYTYRSEIDFFLTDTKNLYFLVADSKEIGFYIVDNQKVASFFSLVLLKHKTDKRRPFYLNETEKEFTIRRFVYDFIGIPDRSLNNIGHRFSINEAKNDAYIELIRTNLEYFSTNFQNIKHARIVSHEELDNKIKSEFKLIYHNYSDVFYLVKDTEVKMFFIIKDKKIISFFKDFRKTGKGKIYPFILSH